MRRVVIAFLLSACSDRLPGPPDPAAYEAMDEEARCTAAEPRAVRCTLALMGLDIDELSEAGGMSRDVAEGMKRNLYKDGPATDDEARTIHRTQCRGSRTSEYQDGIVECWRTSSCKELVACVKGRRGKPTTR